MCRLGLWEICDQCARVVLVVGLLELDRASISAGAVGKGIAVEGEISCLLTDNKYAAGSMAHG